MKFLNLGAEELRELKQISEWNISIRTANLYKKKQFANNIRRFANKVCQSANNSAQSANNSEKTANMRPPPGESRTKKADKNVSRQLFRFIPIAVFES